MFKIHLLETILAATELKHEVYTQWLCFLFLKYKHNLRSNEFIFKSEFLYLLQKGIVVYVKSLPLGNLMYM